MTEGPSKEMTPELKRWLESWKGSMQEVLSQIAGQAISLCIAEEHMPASADDVWYAVTCGGAISGEMSLRSSAASASVLGQMLLGEAQPQVSQLTGEHRQALEELLRQIAGKAATTLSSPAGEVQLGVAASAAPAWPPALSVSFQRASESASPFALEMQISAALLNAVCTQPQAEPSPGVGAVPANYERLIDVELEVKLRFGARQMELRDVLALSPGAVVELDRPLQAPVDLLLDGRVIALGDVVVVDGKYGLRITEVPDPGSVH